MYLIVNVERDWASTAAIVLYTWEEIDEKRKGPKYVHGSKQKSEGMEWRGIVKSQNKNGAISK